MAKALIRLRECAGWSAPLLFAQLGRFVARTHQYQVFLKRDPNVIKQQSLDNIGYIAGVNQMVTHSNNPVQT